MDVTEPFKKRLSVYFGWNNRSAKAKPRLSGIRITASTNCERKDIKLPGHDGMEVAEQLLICYIDLPPI